MKNKQTTAYWIAWSSIFINIILFGIKYYAGIESNSIAIIADAWHSLSDSLTSFVVIIGFWIANRPADNEHPFGHGRSESISAIIVATLLGIVGVNFLIESVSRLNNYVPIRYSDFAILVLILSVLIKESLAQFSIRFGKKIDSESLVADGWHHRSDSIAAGLILIGAAFNIYWWFDSVMGILVAALILYTTFEILKSSVNTLLGKAPVKDTLDEVKRIILDVDHRIRDVHHIKIHTYGDYKELTVDFRLPPEMSVEEAHDIATVASRSVQDKLNIRTTVHIEPFI